MPAATEPASRDAPGWYGKIAPLGDFAQRRLPAALVGVVDAWLVRALRASREQLGERWLDAYLTAPVLRFAWAPGVVGGDAQWCFGVLMPSCDNVGRYFPLLIAQRRSRPPRDRIALDHLEAWFEHLANAATRTLRERASVEAFEQALHEAPPWPAPGAAPWSAPDRSLGTSAHADDGAAHYRFGGHLTLTDWLQAIATDDLQARLAGCSIWWRPGSAAQGDTRTCIHRGLPEPAAFAALLGGG